MKKSLYMVCLSFILAGVFLMAGCDPNPKNESANPAPEPDDTETTVSFESFSPYSIRVDNNSNERLVAFKGSLNPNNLIGGIPTYAKNHGLEKDTEIFNTTGDFPLVLITEAQYNEHKANLQDATTFATIFAFYNKDGTNDSNIQISSKSGGSGRIILNNPTGWNVEIRRDGPTGEVLGYVAANMTNTVLYVTAPDDFSLYPVLKRYVPGDDHVYEAVPKYTSGALVGKPFARDFILPNADSSVSWNLSEVNDIAGRTFSAGGFYLRIINNSNTAVRFIRGDVDTPTSTNIHGIGPANSHLYTIKITRNLDGTYPESETVGQLNIGTPQHTLSIPEHTYKVDYVYSITVSGASASDLSLGPIQESTQTLDLESIF